MFSARPCFECPRSRYATNASEPIQNMPQSGLWRKPVAATEAKLLRPPPQTALIVRWISPVRRRATAADPLSRSGVRFGIENPATLAAKAAATTIQSSSATAAIANKMVDEARYGRHHDTRR